MKKLLIMLHYIDRIWISRFNIKSEERLAKVTPSFNFNVEVEYCFFCLFRSGTHFNFETQILNTARISHVVEFLHLKMTITLNGGFSLCVIFGRKTTGPM